MTPVTFKLQLDGLDPDALQVVRLEGEERLTRPYRFDIDVISSKADLAMEALLAKPATLTLARGSSLRTIHGIILEASESGQAPGDVYAYRLQLVPRISLLALWQHNRSFGTQTAQSVLDVIQSILSDPSGLGLGQNDWSMSVLKPASYAKRDFWAQYDESDFDFLHRLLEHWGIYYFFEQADTHETIVFSDETALAPHQSIDGTLIYDGHHYVQGYAGGAVLSMSRRLKAVSNRVSLSDYNEQTPDRPVKAQSQVPGGTTGTYSEYAAHFLNDAEGEVFARARAEEIGCQRDVFEMQTDSPFQAPGLVFTVSQSFRSSFNQTYLPTVIRHSGQQPLAGAFSYASAPSTPGYHNTLTAIPAAVAYRSPRLLRRPVMSGVMPAVVEAPDGQGDRAVLDASGRYKIALNFDSAVNPVYARSNFIRMTQPYAGPNLGLHFPLLKGTEVAVGWVDGDPDRPMILGAAPNPLTQSPVTKVNETENMIETASGIALVMNDGPGKQSSDSGSPAPAPAAGASTASNSSGVYASFLIPAATGTLPHYLRLGQIASDRPTEAAIVKDASFQASTLQSRGTTLANAAYEGIFSYTPDNRTITTVGNETNVVNGNQVVWAGGTVSTFVGTNAQAAVPGQITLSVGPIANPQASITLTKDGITITAPKVTINGTTSVLVQAASTSASLTLTQSGNTAVLEGGKISCTGPTTVTQTLTVQSACTVSGTMSAQSTLTVTGAVTAKNNCTVTGTVTASNAKIG